MKKYLFKPYLPIFPELFEREKERLGEIKNIKIEHVGSTAIPELGGKGIIDLAIAADVERWAEIEGILIKNGYECVEKACTDERRFFRINLPDNVENSRTYHLHLTHENSLDWKGFIKFRDYLRNNPAKREEYAELKRAAAEASEEVGEKYRQLKAPFFLE